MWDEDDGGFDQLGEDEDVDAEEEEDGEGEDAWAALDADNADAESSAAAEASSKKGGDECGVEVVRELGAQRLQLEQSLLVQRRFIHVVAARLKQIQELSESCAIQATALRRVRVTSQTALVPPPPPAAPSPAASSQRSNAVLYAGWLLFFITTSVLLAARLVRVVYLER